MSAVPTNDAPTGVLERVRGFIKKRPILSVLIVALVVLDGGRMIGGIFAIALPFILTIGPIALIVFIGLRLWRKFNSPESPA